MEMRGERDTAVKIYSSTKDLMWTTERRWKRE